MPRRYTYECEEGHAHSIVVESAKHKPKTVVCRTCERTAHWTPKFYAPSPKNWPMESVAAGVNPLQIREAGEDLMKAGIPTQFTKEGAAIFEDRQHRNRVLEHLGMHDRDAGYGDRTPGKPFEEISEAPDLGDM